MFSRFDRVMVMGQEVALDGFDLSNETAVVALCRNGKHQARVALESVEFLNLTPHRSALAESMAAVLSRTDLNPYLIQNIPQSHRWDYHGQPKYFSIVR